MISGNRGEWSEMYAFMRLLGEGRIYAADEDLQRINKMYFPIMKIIREEVQKSKYEYHTGDTIKIYYNDKLIKSISSDDFTREADRVYNAIVENQKGTFSVKAAESFMSSIFVHKLSAPAQDKRDITVQLHDIQTGFEKIVGFSIKSELGSPPTLLNAGKTTNFTYIVSGLSDYQIDRINRVDTKNKIKDRLQLINENSMGLEFYCLDNEIFNENLKMIDSNMPVIIAHLLKHYYTSNLNSCTDLILKTARENPLSQTQSFYTYKMKELLCAIALGMKPATAWDGRDEATGGYIVVKANGDVLAYHIYNRDSFKGYLLRNTRLETGSTSRHEFGKLYRVDGHTFIKLNLQIRFM